MIPGAAVTEPATRATSRRHYKKHEINVPNVSKPNTQETNPVGGIITVTLYRVRDKMRQI
jgi:hypothetical protein